VVCVVLVAYIIDQYCTTFDKKVVDIVVVGYIV